jgi:DNA-binding LacI/PurR family transcriptional regulator
MKDVAKHAGVSVATVSNVLTGKQAVSENIRLKVHDSIKELNYNINLIARGLKTQRTNTIGVILTDVTTIFYLDVLKGIMETAAMEQYNITIFSSNNNFETERSLVKYLYSNRVDGIILDSCVDFRKGKKWAQELAHGRTASAYSPPVVSLECRLDTRYVSSVGIDYRYWSGRITRHLIDIGRRRIFFIAGPMQIEHEHSRLEGYKEALRENGIPVLDELISREGDFFSANGYDSICTTLKNDLRFDAVQASNDQAAIGAIKAFNEFGIRVPDDVAVCGFDNVFPSTLITPAVTTISVPRRELGVLAVQEVLRRIRDPQASPSRYVVDAALVIRASTFSEARTDWNLENW